jgi:hypothetical protein
MKDERGWSAIEQHAFKKCKQLFEYQHLLLLKTHLHRRCFYGDIAGESDMRQSPWPPWAMQQR